MMNADVIGDPSLRHGDDGAAHDRHDHDAGAISGKRSEFSTPKVKILGNMIELKKPTRYAATSQMPRRQHRDGHQPGCADSANAQQSPRLHFL